MSAPLVYIIGPLQHFDEDYVGSIQLWGVGTFWSIGTILVKKLYMKILKIFLNYTNSSCAIFNQNCPNTPKNPDTHQLHTTHIHQ